MEKRREFEAYRELLAKVVRARGGDAQSEARRYAWRERRTVPLQAMPLSMLLTGGHEARAQ